MGRVHTVVGAHSLKGTSREMPARRRVEMSCFTYDSRYHHVCTYVQIAVDCRMAEANKLTQKHAADGSRSGPRAFQRQLHNLSCYPVDSNTSGKLVL